MVYANLVWLHSINEFDGGHGVGLVSLYAVICSILFKVGFQTYLEEEMIMVYMDLMYLLSISVFWGWSRKFISCMMFILTESWVFEKCWAQIIMVCVFFLCKYFQYMSLLGGLDGVVSCMIFYLVEHWILD